MQLRTAVFRSQGAGEVFITLLCFWFVLSSQHVALVCLHCKPENLKSCISPGRVKCLYQFPNCLRVNPCALCLWLPIPQSKSLASSILYTAGFWKLEAHCSIKNQLMWRSCMKEVLGKRNPLHTNQCKFHWLVIHCFSKAWKCDASLSPPAHVTWLSSQTRESQVESRSHGNLPRVAQFLQNMYTPWVCPSSHIRPKLLLCSWMFWLPCDSKDK